MKPGNAGRAGSGRSANDLSAIRASIGLSSLKPSEMVEGLDKAAERAEKQEKRESAKRKAGGAGAVNTALHVDGTGKRWSRQIKLGMAAAVAVVVLALTIMIYAANRQPIKPRQANEVSRQRLAALRNIAGQIRPFDSDDDITIEKVRERLSARIDTDLKDVETEIKALKDNRRPIDERLLRHKQEMMELQELKDGWGEPLELTLPEPCTLQIAVKSSAADALTPVTVKIRKKK